MSRPPRLDFATDRPALRRQRHWLTATLVLALCVQLGWLLQEFVQLRRDQAQQQEQLQHLQHKASPVRAGLSPHWSAQETQLAASLHTMLGALATPWDTLLTAVERARVHQQPVIHSLQSKADDGTLVIQLQARDFARVADFMEQLARQPGIAEVQLASEAQDTEGALTAVVRARWEARP